MNYDLIEGLSEEELINLYDEILETPLIGRYGFYFSEVVCDTGRVLRDVYVCTGALDHFSTRTRQITAYEDYRFTCYEMGCGGYYGQGCKMTGYYRGTC